MAEAQQSRRESLGFDAAGADLSANLQIGRLDTTMSSEYIRRALRRAGETPMHELLTASLEWWKVDGAVYARARWRTAVDARGAPPAEPLRIARAPAGLPFRWQVTYLGRTRSVSSVAGVLRTVRAVVDPEAMGACGRGLAGRNRNAWILARGSSQNSKTFGGDPVDIQRSLSPRDSPLRRAQEPMGRPPRRLQHKISVVSGQIQRLRRRNDFRFLKLLRAWPPPPR